MAEQAHLRHGDLKHLRASLARLQFGRLFQRRSAFGSDVLVGIGIQQAFGSRMTMGD